MGSMVFQEPSLDRPYSAMGKLLAEVSRVCGVSEKISKLDDYLKRLQDEMSKIEAFKRELPLCMLLLNDAIVTMKNKLTEYKNRGADPVLEEFIRIKKSEDDEKVDTVKEDDIVNSKDKMNWMTSVQLWNSDSQPNSSNSGSRDKKQITMLDNCKKRAEEETHPQEINDLLHSNKKRIAVRTFVPYKECTDFPSKIIAKEEDDESDEVMRLSLCSPNIKYSREKVNSIGLSPKSSCSISGSFSATNGRSNFKAGQQQTTRKQRRSWSPELHRRFVNALHQLGGAQAATPKQIRDHMQVEGLTNDEVKSHLQKFRLHTRKIAPTTQSFVNTNKSVVLGGLLVSEEQYGESSKQKNSQSNSPIGPLLLTGSSHGTSTTGRQSLEDEDDEKSESHSWKSQLHLVV